VVLKDTFLKPKKYAISNSCHARNLYFGNPVHRLEPTEESFILAQRAKRSDICHGKALRSVFDSGKEFIQLPSAVKLDVTSLSRYEMQLHPIGAASPLRVTS
jgi:hypothetical protein